MPNLSTLIIFSDIKSIDLIFSKSIFFATKICRWWNSEIFEFRGFTSLYDSLCEIISYATVFKDDTTIFVISDGEDNSSKNYDKESANKMCDIAINIYKYNIIHCHTDTNILNIPTVTYDVNDIEHIFENLKI